MENDSNINSQFVPYELSLKLKNIGFDEPCLYYFNKQENNQLWQDLDSGYYRNSIVSRGNLLWGDTYDNGNVSAPLWQQTEEFFRKEYDLHSFIHSHARAGEDARFWEFVIEGDKSYSGYASYEEARQACLEKLIELHKEK